MRYIPEHERDTRYPLWCVLYDCSVPWHQMRTVDEIQNESYQLSGDAQLDQASLTEMRNVKLPVQRIAELVDDGARVMLQDPWKHASTIYYAILAHLNAWNQRMSFGINDSRMPKDDLRKLDSLANVLHPFVVESMPREYSAGSFAALVRKHGGVDRTALRAELFEESSRKRVVEGAEHKRAKISDFMSTFK